MVDASKVRCNFKAATREASTIRCRDYLQAISGPLQGWRWMIAEVKRNPNLFSAESLARLLNKSYWLEDLPAGQVSRVWRPMLAAMIRREAIGPKGIDEASLTGATKLVLEFLRRPEQQRKASLAGKTANGAVWTTSDIPGYSSNRRGEDEETDMAFCVLLEGGVIDYVVGEGWVALNDLWKEASVQKWR